MVGAVNGQIAGRIARTLLLLVARIVLLVHHDQAQSRQRSQHRHARAQYDACLAEMRRQPGLQPLRRRHAAVHADQAMLWKAACKALLQLRRQVDLRHHHQHLGLRILVQQRGRCLQINLGLAAAGAAEQQRRCQGLAGLCLSLLLQQRGQGCLLLCRQGQRGFGAVRGCGQHRLVQLLQPARQLRAIHVTQLGRQCRQRHLTDAALVITCGEFTRAAASRYPAPAAYPAPR